MEFICSRFYKWTRVLLWIVVVIGIGISRKLEFAVVSVVVALGYTIVPQLIARRDAARPAARSEIEEFKKNSPVVEYLRTLFDDIAHVNEVEEERFSFITFILSDQRDSSARLMFGFSYSETIQTFKKLFDTDPDNEAMKKNYREVLGYERDGYIAKNASFKNELLGKCVGDFTTLDGNEVDDDYPSFQITLRSFAGIMAMEKGMRDAAASVICELAREQHFKVSYNAKRSDGKRVVQISFD